jgi:hypothetical protein
MMQILNKTLKLTGTEKEEIAIGFNVAEGLVFVLDNRGPSAVELREIGRLEANRFVVIGGIQELRIHPPEQFTAIDISVFTRPK